MIRYPVVKNWQCGTGWYLLIEELIEKLNHLCEDVDVDVDVVQIKEKLGMLSFHLHGTVEMYKIIHNYENKSLTICEECGKEGKYRGNLHWKQTLCDKHYKEKRKNEIE